MSMPQKSASLNPLLSAATASHLPDFSTPLCMSPPSPSAKIRRLSSTTRTAGSTHTVVSGYPYVGDDDLDSFLETQVLTPELDELAPWLRLVATPKGSHIKTLHEQIVSNRKIVPTEQARLHMLWYRDTIFLKPLPVYLLPLGLKRGVAERISSNPALTRAVNGFLRSYVYLIQSPLDLEIAIDEGLIPREYEDDVNPLFEFLSKYRHISDGPDVSPRYCYGELRLSRVNFYNRLVRRQLYYHKVYRFYNAYFGRFMEPFLFVFGTATLILSAFQVILATITEEDRKKPWKDMVGVARWSSIGSMLFVVIAVAILGLLFLFLLLREARYAFMKYLRARWRRRGENGSNTASDY